MKLKINMDSGIQYDLDYPEYHYKDFIDSLYNVQKLPVGSGEIKVLKNGFIILDKEETIIFNPSHVSSIEVLEKF